MAEETSTPFVARATDLDALQAHWAAARSGEPRIVRLQAPLGGGKRALVGELARQALADDEDTLVWRTVLSDERDGLQNLIQLYAGLFTALHRSPGMRGRVEMALNAQLPHEPKRTQGWFQAFIEGLKKGAPKAGATEFQVIMPRDNPLIGLVEITLAIARKFPILLDIQGVKNIHSVGLCAFFEALLDELLTQEDENFHLLALLGMGAAKAPPRRNTNRRTAPLPLRRGGKAYAELAAHESVRAHLKWDQRCFGEVLSVDA